MTPEQSQLVTDRRTRMLENIAAGRPAWEGFTAEQIRECLDLLRSSRANIAAGATKARKAKADKASKGVGEDFYKKLGLE